MSDKKHILRLTKMTNDIAFDLGAFNYPCFYDYACWLPNKEDFEYVAFFEWDSYGMYDSDFGLILYGELNEKKFKTLEHKYYYIKGRLSSYSVTIKNNSITIGYANSIKSRDRFIKWIKELIKFNFSEDESLDIETTDGITTIPYTPTLTLKADNKTINYFR